MRVKVRATGMYAYPDVAAVCGGSSFEDEHVDTLTNPAVIIEVLSPSTEAYDRGEKFAHYRRLASLQEYVLVAQDKVRIEHFARRNDDSGQWVLTEFSDPNGTLRLASIGCDLALRGIYDRVEFPDAQA
jgi:Uma2 family endonuclease